MASKGIKTCWLSLKESRLLRKMANSGYQAGNMLDKSGKYGHTK